MMTSSWSDWWKIDEFGIYRTSRCLLPLQGLSTSEDLQLSGLWKFWPVCLGKTKLIFWA